MNSTVKKVFYACALAAFCFGTSNAMNLVSEEADQNQPTLSKRLINTELSTYIKKHNYEQAAQCLKHVNGAITFSQEITIDDMYWLLLSAAEHNNVRAIKKIFYGKNCGINPMFLFVDPTNFDVCCEHRSATKEVIYTDFSEYDYAVMHELLGMLEISSKSFDMPAFLTKIININPKRMLLYAVQFGLPKVLSQVLDNLGGDENLEWSSCLYKIIPSSTYSSDVMSVLLSSPIITTNVSSFEIIALCLWSIECGDEKLISGFFDTDDQKLSAGEIIQSLLANQKEYGNRAISNDLTVFQIYAYAEECKFQNVLKIIDDNDELRLALQESNQEAGRDGVKRSFSFSKWRKKKK